MPKKKTGQRKKHDKMKARQKEIGLRGERKDHLNIAERYHARTPEPLLGGMTWSTHNTIKAVQLHYGVW